MKTICEKYQIPTKDISKETVAAMMEYAWPGNIRELYNVMERLITLVDGQGIYYDDYQRFFLEHDKTNIQKANDFQTMQKEIGPNINLSLETLKRSELQKEKELLMQILKEEQGNKTRAAKKLGISRATLYNKLKEFHI